jgi:predicted aspartyl protease
LASAFACAALPDRPRAVFPDDPPAAVLPIRDPIDGPELEVEVELVHDERRARLWSVVDSGFTGVSIPDTVAEALALDDVGSATTHGVSGSVVERVARADMVLGPLVVSDVAINRSKSLSVLGQPILGAVRWEVSWTHGVLTLGATPWELDRATLLVPLRPRSDNELDELSVTLGGHEQLLLFDTGAVASTIPETVGDSLGLPSEPFAGVFAGAAGTVVVSRAFVADVVLGGVELHDRRLLALKARSWALLGRDVLHEYDFQVVPGEALLLRPRGDVHASAPRRLGRWDFVARCRTPGCVSGRVEREAGHGRLELVVEAGIERPGHLLFGCATSASPEPLVSMAALLAAGTVAGPFHHIVLRYERLERGRYQVRLPHAGALWFEANGSGCTELRLLDIVPLGNGRTAPTAPLAILRP